jgi:hypothetical protein
MFKPKLLHVFGICTAPFLDQRMAPLVSFAVHETIPPGVIARDHFAAFDIMRGNGNVVDLGPELISQGIPLLPKRMLKKGEDLNETSIVGLVVACMVGKDVRAGGHVYGLSQAPEPSVKAVTVKGSKHIVKNRIMVTTKLAQLIVQGRWNLKAV